MHKADVSGVGYSSNSYRITQSENRTLTHMTDGKISTFICSKRCKLKTFTMQITGKSTVVGHLLCSTVSDIVP